MACPPRSRGVDSNWKLRGNAVFAFVAHDALLNLAQSGRRVLEARDRLPSQGPGGFSLGRLDRLAKGGQIVVGHVSGGLGAQHEAVLVAGEGHEVFVAIRIGAEQALGLAGFQVAQVQERPIALVGGAASAEVDRVSLLAQHPATVRKRAEQRIARISVAIVLVEIEPRARRALVHVQEPDVAPAPYPFALGEHERAALGAPGVCRLNAVLGSEHLLGLCREGRVQTHEPVAVRHLGHGIPAVERLDPEERVGSGGTPRDRARAQRHTVDRDLVGHRQGGDRRHPFSLRIPHLDLAGRSATRPLRETRDRPDARRAGTRHPARTRP